MGKAEKAGIEKCRIVIENARISYPHVFKPQGMKNKPDSKKSYSLTMLVDKTSSVKKIKGAMDAAKIQKWGDQKNWPKGIRSPIQDGDAPKNADKEGYAGCWVIKATSSEDQKPDIVDEQVNKIINPRDFYPGCYANVSVLAYIWDNEFGVGVGFILDAAQKCGDGKSFENRKTAAEIFQPLGTGEEAGETEGFEEGQQEESFL